MEAKIILSYLSTKKARIPNILWPNSIVTANEEYWSYFSVSVLENLVGIAEI